MIVLYTLANRDKWTKQLTNHTEMCGEFKDLNHFYRSMKVEETYNRYCTAHKILREK